MDLLFFIRRTKEPTEYNQYFCYHISNVSLFIVFNIIYQCIQLLRLTYLGVQDGLTTRLFSLPILALLFVSLMLIHHEKRMGIYLWVAVSILTLVACYFWATPTSFMLITIFWCVVQLGFIWMMRIAKDGKPAWRVLFPKND